MTRPYTCYNITRVLLAILMVSSSICTWAQNVAKIESTEYATLQEAIDAVTEGQTVTLIANIEETATYTINKTVTIDFGTYTITASHTTSNASSNADKVFDITAGGNLTVTGSTGGVKDATVLGIFNNAGTLTINGGHYTTTTDDYGVVYNNGGTCTIAGGTLTGAYAAIYAKGTNSVTVNNGTLNGAWIGIQANAGTTLDVKGGTITASNQSHKLPGIQLKGEGTVATISSGTISGFNGIVVLEKSSLTVSGTANISGKNIAITGNGDSNGTTINISGGTITNDNDVAIYHPQDGTLTITDGTITGTTALEVRSGTVNISGGTLHATAAEYTCNPNDNGTTTVGAALAIAQHTTKQNIAVNISGGTFTGVMAISESNPQHNDPAPQVTMSVTDGTFNGGLTVEDVQGGFISGGTFDQAVPAEYCVDGKAPYVDEEGHCTIIAPETEVPTDAEALSNGSYYKVLNGAIVAAGTTATTISVLKNPTADAITISAGAIITLAVANEVTLSKPITNNGTLSMSGTVSGAINNSGTLTITSGTISGAITIAAFEASVKIASGVTSTSAIALSTELQTENVLKSSTTKVSGYTSYWVEKKVMATVALTGEPTAEQTDAAEALVANTSIKEVTGLTENQSLTITVTSVELTASKVMKAEFEVKLIGTDGEEVTGTVPEVTFHLPTTDGLEGKWANLWHDATAIPGMDVVGATNGYVTVTATSFSPFSYEIIETPIAQIGKTKFGTVADAIAEATAEETEIKLLDNVSEDITVAVDKNVKMTIGELTISGDITNNGTLTITDGTIEGTSKTITNTGALTISGTAIISNPVTATAGTLAISGGTISNTIETSDAAALTISNGTITGALSVGGSGTNTISGGTISGAVATNAATTISGGEISSNITNSAALAITAGTFTGNIANTDPGTVAISGGTHTVLPVSGFCATGYMPIKNEAGKYNMTNHWTITDATVIDDSHFEHLTSTAGYKVATATYNRNTGMVSAGNAETMYGTICLPFNITAAPTGMTLYKATSITASTLTITEVSYPVAAGTPLIFELSAAASSMTVTSTAGEGIAVNTVAPATTPVTTPEESKNLLVGTYQQKVIDNTTTLQSIYYLNGDKFHQAVSSLTVPKFRAYLDVTGSTSARPLVFDIVNGENDTTSINTTEALDGVTAIYDLNGRKLNSLQRGMNIMRRADGSTLKVMVK